MGKYYFENNKRISSSNSSVSEFKKGWSPIIFPCFGFEFAFFNNLSINLENTLEFNYTNEILKSRYTHFSGESILHYVIKNEDYYFKPVNINIGIYYYF